MAFRRRSRRAAAPNASHSTSRIACALVGDLPLRAALRSHPEWADEPLAIASGNDGRAQLISVSPALRRLGLLPGRSLAHARAVCGELKVRVASPELERSAREALLDAALSLSPRARLAPPPSGAFAAEAAVWLDAGGTSALFESESQFASVLAARCEALGLPVVVAVASSRYASLLACRKRAAELRHEAGSDVPPLVIAPAAETRFLASLPLDWLEPSDSLAERLTRFGVRTVDDLLRLPRRTLSHRLGPEALALARRAGGEQHEEPLPEPSSTTLSEGVDLEAPIAQLEALLFALRGAISRLGERLSLRGLTFDTLDIRLGLEGGGSDARRIGSSTPTSDVRVWLRLARASFEARPPHAAIESLHVLAEGRAGRHDQLDLFRPVGPDPSALGETIAALESLCGPEGVGAPALANDHRPGRYALEPFRLTNAERRASNDGPKPGAGERTRRTRERARTRPGTSPRGDRVEEAAPPDSTYASPPNADDASARAPIAGERTLAVRALRPPVSAQVQMRGGQPHFLRSAIANGAILELSGPWRTTGHWWSDDERYALDHYDAYTEDGTVLRLCFDWTERRWCVDAIYD